MAPYDEAALTPLKTVNSPTLASPDHFKEALARLAGGLAIISGWSNGAPHGLLVSSITGLSVDPPRFLFCIRKEASSHKAFLQDDLCSVAILSDEDEREAEAFIRPELKGERFKSGKWSLAAPTPPLLRTALSSTVCTIASRIDADSHTILIAQAERLHLNHGEPLLAYDRSLRRLASQSPA
jgi:flavin reductase